ncbi:hypothetical protein [Clostridium brassicae]|uniref:Amidohydrolase 3 domain-containing protein n=1 Tax=Clostridium brassicae TaxID=2999072 RepID=A0ABT4DD43_9CLOT|nr:hypothetical protein [Clostridium brassicae]MCY6960236.1 hypothetical protein [Clostridium brassicae]
MYSISPYYGNASRKIIFTDCHIGAYAFNNSYPTDIVVIKDGIVMVSAQLYNYIQKHE